MAHWRRTRLLAISVMSVWLVVALVLPFFALVSNWARYGGVGGYVFVSEGALILLLALALWFSRRQQGIDREFAMAEED